MAATRTGRDRIVRIASTAEIDGEEQFSEMREMPSRALELTPLPSACGGFSDAVGGTDIVLFRSEILYALEADSLEVHLIRVGALAVASSVTFTTVAGSAIANTHFEMTSGVVRFAPQQGEASFFVPIIMDPRWAATLEFRIYLEHPVSCELDRCLRACRVKIIDTSCFPSDRYKSKIGEGAAGIEQISSTGLFWEFLKLVYSSDGIAWRTAVTLVADQMKNLYLYFTLVVTVYCADVLFAAKPGTACLLPGLSVSLLVPGNRLASARLLGLLYFAPMFLIRVWDLAQARLDLGGQVQVFLRSNLFRKYLNYSVDSRQEVGPTDLVSALSKDCNELSASYMHIVQLGSSIGRVIVVIYFVVAANESTSGVAVMLPICLSLFAMFRAKANGAAYEAEGDKELTALRTVSNICHNYPLISDYRNIPLATDTFTDNLQESEDASVSRATVEVNTTGFPEMIGPLMTGVYIANSAEYVLNGETSVGSFLGTSKAFAEMTDSISQLYMSLISLASALPSLRSLTRLLNMPTDVLDQKQLQMSLMEVNDRIRVGLMRQRQQELSHGNRLHLVDKVPFLFQDMSFRHDVGDPIFSDMCYEIPQGKLVAVTSAAPGAGRSTLLKLIGQVVFPTQGVVFLPVHLRVLHVSSTPLFIGMGLWENLTLGDSGADEERVRHILMLLRMEKSLEVLGGKAADERWFLAFSETELAKVHLARAFIANPEVLVLQRPLASLSVASGSRGVVLGAIVQYVRQRGLCFDARRPRTCFFTPESSGDAAVADVTLSINGDGSISASAGATATVSSPTRGAVATDGPRWAPAGSGFDSSPIRSAVATDGPRWAAAGSAVDSESSGHAVRTAAATVGSPTRSAVATDGPWAAAGSAFDSESSGYAVRTASGSTEVESVDAVPSMRPVDRAASAATRTRAVWTPPRLRVDGALASPRAHSVPSTSRLAPSSSGASWLDEPQGEWMRLSERQRASVAEVARLQRQEAARLRQPEDRQSNPMISSRSSSRGDCMWTPRDCSFG